MIFIGITPPFSMTKLLEKSKYSGLVKYLYLKGSILWSNDRSNIKK